MATPDPALVRALTAKVITNAARELRDTSAMDVWDLCEQDLAAVPEDRQDALVRAVLDALRTADVTHELAHLTADVVLFGTNASGELHVLLIKRRWPPHAGAWALPGGHLDTGEDPRTAARRELLEETGITVRDPELTLAGVYAGPGRDPRGRYVTFAYTALLPDVLGMLPNPKAADDAAEARWVPVTDLPNLSLAFDHGRIIDDALAADRRSRP